jgi:predicted kinase
MNNLILLCGLPGSGKTTAAKRFIDNDSNAVWLSSDALREEMWGDVNDQKNAPVIFQEMNKRAVAALNKHKTVIYDATNLRADKRKATLQEITRAVKPACSDFQAWCYIVVCSITECKRRQFDRERVVPDEVIDRMARNFQMPWYNEGWDYIGILETGPMQDLTKEHRRALETPHDNPHHTMSIGAHCAAACAEMRKLLHERKEFSGYAEILIEAAYQHDIGKRKTKSFINSKGITTDVAHYYSHESVSAYLWLSGDQSSCWNLSDRLAIGLLIQWHMQPYFLKEETEEETIKWFAKKGFDETLGRSIWLLHEADLAAH